MSWELDSPRWCVLNPRKGCTNPWTAGEFTSKKERSLDGSAKENSQVLINKGGVLGGLGDLFLNGT